MLFVFPSILFGFALSPPTLSWMYILIFKDDSGIDTSPLPSKYAVT
jgi:hypothetical protein